MAVRRYKYRNRASACLYGQGLILGLRESTELVHRVGQGETDECESLLFTRIGPFAMGIAPIDGQVLHVA